MNLTEKSENKGHIYLAFSTDFLQTAEIRKNNNNQLIYFFVLFFVCSMRHPVSQVRIIPNNVPEAESQQLQALCMCVSFSISSPTGNGSQLILSPSCSCAPFSPFLPSYHKQTRPASRSCWCPNIFPLLAWWDWIWIETVCDRHQLRREFLRFECCNPFQSAHIYKYIKIFFHVDAGLFIMQQ